MKEGWEYKKLGEVCIIERGGSPRPISSYITTDEDGINWIKIGDAIEGSKYISSTKERIKKEGMKKSRYVRKGDFILSNSMSFGKPYILNIDGCIHDGWLVLHDENNAFVKDYLYYLLSSPTMYSNFKKLAVGGVVNNLNSALVRSVRVAIPPLSEQQSIVAELDKINEIIDLKKAQLKDLDLLAQSIFYDMFGDPIENSKGWEVKKLGEVSSIIAGGDKPKDISESPKGDYIYPVIANGEGTKGVLGYSNKYRISIPSVTIGARGASIGNCRIVEENFTPVVRLITISPKECLDVTYLYFYAKDIRYKSNGAGQAQLTVPNIKGENIPLPPLSLQQSFSSKIQSIESQKSVIKQSLAEAETLLASRMDYYFN